MNKTQLLFYFNLNMLAASKIPSSFFHCHALVVVNKIAVIFARSETFQRFSSWSFRCWFSFIAARCCSFWAIVFLYQLYNYFSKKDYIFILPRNLVLHLRWIIIFSCKTFVISSITQNNRFRGQIAIILNIRVRIWW